MDADDIELTKKIIRARKSVKRKYLELQRGHAAVQRISEEKYKPIVNPIKELASLKKTSKRLKAELNSNQPTATVNSTQTPVIKSSVKSNPSEQGEIKGSSSGEDDDYDVKIEDAADDDDEEYYSEASDASINELLHKRYIDLAIHDTNNLMDHRYGVHHDPDTKAWKIGNTEIEFHQDSNNFSVSGKVYDGTAGLYELIFKKSPKNYTNSDLQQYKQILIQTNAHKRGYYYENPILGTRDVKYTKVIKGLFAKKGAGFELKHKFINDNKLDYVYWDSPSELVQRLMLLHASQQAGNNSHDNEIISILEELVEAKIII